MTDHIIITAQEALRRKRIEKAQSLAAAPRKPYIYKGDEFHYTPVGEKQMILIRDGHLCMFTDFEVAALVKRGRRLVSSEERKDTPEVVAEPPENDREAALQALSKDDYQMAKKVKNRLGLVTPDETKETIYAVLSDWLSTQTTES